MNSLFNPHPEFEPQPRAGSVSPQSLDMSTRERLLEITKRRSILELPIGVYVVTSGGEIVEANGRAREILGLPPEGEIGRDITDFYKDSSDRDMLRERLTEKEKEGKFLVSRLAFEGGGREIYIQDHARTVKDPETQEVLGYFCCMTDVTEEMLLQQLFDDLPVGAYRLDRDDRITRANDAFVTTLGYDSPDELLGRRIREFYHYPEEAQEFRAALEKAKTVKDHVVQVVRRNGQPVYIRVSAAMLVDASGEYDGREGTIMEAPEERYKKILDVAPIGLFEVEKYGDEDRIIHHNKHFLEITEFHDDAQADNYDMRKLHASAEDYAEFIKELEEKGELRDREVRVRTLRYTEKVVRVSVRPVRAADSRTLAGYVGVVSDITELRNRVEELTDDVGQVLHTYSAALVEIKHSTDAIIESMSPNPFEGAETISPELAVEASNAPRLRLVRALERLLDLTRARERETDRLARTRDLLTRLTDMLRNYEGEVPYPELRPAALCEATLALLRACEYIKGEKLPRELLREIKTQGREMLRILNLYTLLQVRDLTFTMGHPVRALREFVISGRRVESQKYPQEVSTLITKAINNVSGFAKTRGVQFRKRADSPRTLVNVVEQDVIRALANVIHNAVKYSWMRADGGRWISVSAHQEGDRVDFVFENYGVPIPEDEIEQGSIFELGFRGRMSSDRGRTGTGVGLADALRVAREHGGNISVKSLPAIYAGRDDPAAIFDVKKTGYNRPFITTVTFSLPAHRREED